MQPELQNRAKELVGAYDARAARYDTLVIKNRRTANVLEAVVAIGVVIIGTSGAVGLFSQLNKFGGGAVSAGYLAAFWSLLPALLQLAVSMVMAYLSVFKPREKQAMFGSASSACATVSQVAKVVAEADLGGNDDKTLILTNLISSIYTALEAATIDDQPPLPEVKAKKHL